MAKSVVAIVGRPNVGKSTFFNRCVGQRHAIVDDMPGVTRDRLYKETDWCGHDFVLVDTGGIIPDSIETIDHSVYDQVKLAIDEADVIIFMVDGKQGPTGADEDVANLLRRTKKPVVLAVNKIDTPNEHVHIPEFYSLGLGEPFGVSAMRGTGSVGDLLDLIVEKFPEHSRIETLAKKNSNETRAERLDRKQKQLEEESYDSVVARSRKGEKKFGRDQDNRPEQDESFSESIELEIKEPISIALIGKPNVGKSSILNILCGKERTIVSAEPGTTRDAIDTAIKFHGRDITLIDTAGIRRKSRVDYGIEAFSVVRSIAAIDRADVAILIMDVNEPLTEQDQKIAAKVEEAGRAIVLVLNKWDLVEDKSSPSMNRILESVKKELRHVSYAEILFTSAITKTRVAKIIEAAERAHDETRRRIATNLVNEIVNEAVALVPPPAGKRGKRLKVYYSTQVSASPPTFVLFVNDERLLPASYKTYLERKIREAFGFTGTPIRITARPKKNSPGRGRRDSK